ncbi:MAG: hypothetical protein KJP23_09185 [Deltaproteobacteria bacterium]|nr:hypothetical protein [Deltaproteobacteria bacterium]
MAILKKDLSALRNDFKALEKKMEKLLKAAESNAKPQKTTKAKAVRKAPAKKKAAQVTATDQILKIIKRSKKGVDVQTLKTKTGFDDKKVRNIVFRAAKEGRIKKSGRGVYVGF